MKNWGRVVVASLILAAAAGTVLGLIGHKHHAKRWQLTYEREPANYISLCPDEFVKAWSLVRSQRLLRSQRSRTPAIVQSLFGNGRTIGCVISAPQMPSRKFAAHNA